MMTVTTSHEETALTQHDRLLALAKDLTEEYERATEEYVAVARTHAEKLHALQQLIEDERIFTGARHTERDGTDDTAS